VFASALLFACVHSWPTSVPLFLLGLLLGWLAYRTQSLIPSITLHVLFNLSSCVELGLGYVIDFINKQP
jgi:membrane protease YdiL (CAAX protease family)